ncbi:MAG: hypothetical protein JSU65_00185 [Candidatus Zixiibacteriota bacterium]|nr:MAG: hypothetical protein JSU65_00185 [candidate division Zixibacteria bacterium]
MSKIEDQYEASPRLLAGVGLAAVVVAFITLVPFPASQIVGYQITLAGMNAGATVSTDVLVSTLAAVGYEGVQTSVAQEADLYVYSLAGLSSEEDARTIATALARVAVVDRKVVVKPIVLRVSAPLYAQAVERVRLVRRRPVKLVYEDGRLVLDGRDFQSIVSSRDYTDEQVVAQIDSVLAEFGIGADEVKVEAETSADGYTRRLCLSMVNDTLLDTDAPALEISIRKGDLHLRTDGAKATIAEAGVEREDLLLFRCCDKDFKGKSIIVVVELEMEEE